MSKNTNKITYTNTQQPTEPDVKLGKGTRIISTTVKGQETPPPKLVTFVARPPTESTFIEENGRKIELKPVDTLRFKLGGINGEGVMMVEMDPGDTIDLPETYARPTFRKNLCSLAGSRNKKPFLVPLAEDKA